MARDLSNRIDTEKQAFWIRTLAQWESSGDSARAYCLGHGLKETQFHWWKKVLQDRGKWKPGSSGKPSTLSPEKPSVSFAAVELRESIPSEISEPLELCVGDRYQIRIPPGFDPFTLERVLSVLEGRGC
jgi:transposase